MNNTGHHCLRSPIPSMGQYSVGSISSLLISTSMILLASHSILLFLGTEDFLALDEPPSKRQRKEEEGFQWEAGSTNTTGTLPEDLGKALWKEYPCPSMPALTIPVADKDIACVLGKDFPSQTDKSFTNVQLAIVASATPIIDMVSELSKQGFMGGPEELMPTSEVFKVARETIALTGNAFN